MTSLVPAIGTGTCTFRKIVSGKLMLLRNSHSTINRLSPRVIRVLALIGGLMQVIVALAILFLPVFVTCYLNESECRRQSYIQLGGSILGYVMFAAMIVVGIVVIITHMNPTTPPRGRILWLAAVSSFVVVILGAWSIGVTFALGGALLLIAALAN